MQALRNKKGHVARLLLVAGVSALSAAPVFADLAEPPKSPALAVPAQGPKSLAPAARPLRPKSPAPAKSDPDMHRVVPQVCVPAKGKFVWNFKEEELGKVLEQVADLTCRTILVNDSVNKNMTMTLFGKAPLTPKEAWDILIAAMAAKGLALIEQGKTWTVIKRNELKNYSTPFYSSALNVANNEAIGTFFHKVEHAAPDTLRNIGKMLVSKDGLVELVADKFLLVIDSNSNNKRLERIFNQVDIEDALNKIHVVKIEHADVKTVDKQVRELFDLSGGGMGLGGPPGMRRRRPEDGRSALNIRKVLADERTNSLIVEADSDSFEKLKDIIKNVLDQGASDLSGKGKINVYALRFGDAEKIATTINNSVKSGGGRARRGFRPRDEESSEVFEGEINVTAHKDSNMLVIVASQNDYKSLLPIIMQLDVKRAQVYMEAAIMDIRINNDNKFGINAFTGLMGPGKSLGLLANPGGRGIVEDLTKGFAQNSVGAAAASTLGLPLGQALGALAILNNFTSSGVLGIVGAPLPGAEGVPSFGAVLQALSTNSNVDILSTPYLLTSDNQEAVMKVGQKVPTVKGVTSLGAGLGGGAAMQNITYEPVELSLKVTPHVGAPVGRTKTVRLDIEQEVNELGNQLNLGPNGNQHIIQTKSAKTSIVLKDQQTGVIGGLMHNKTNKIDTKIPFLGDIPILGWLFKTRKTDNEKTNLVLFITPYIIETDDDYRRIVDKKLKEREEFASLYFGGKLKNYDPYVDYEKKSGPVSSMLMAIDAEMIKPENGGPGDGTETIIVPKASSAEPPQVTPPVLSPSAESVHLQREFGADPEDIQIPESELSHEPKAQHAELQEKPAGFQHLPEVEVLPEEIDE